VTIFRPDRVNKRAFSGNAGFVGPTVTATCSASTTTCESTTNSKDSCVCSALVLGKRCSFCGCPCCDIVCGCDCTVCTRTVPSGMWRTPGQYEARDRDAWGGPSSSNTTETCLCCINEGHSNISNLVDYKGYYIKQCGGTKIFVADSSSQISCCWPCRACGVACANSVLGSCGWFLPSCACLEDFLQCAEGCPGRYWDGTGVPAFNFYMSNTFGNQTNWFWALRWLNNSGGVVQAPGFAFAGNRCNHADAPNIRVFRCV
tara:strand:- start:1253 stop:2029 length:777 start_codon:yes stop_codon:yes gene_type:complete